MNVLLYVASALCAYLAGGWNPAITLSKAVYKTDIRTVGSGNPGFTNFRRCFGNLGWLVLVLDLSKAAVVVALSAHLFALEGGKSQTGAVYAGLFAVLGHCYPAWYGFRGGKGFLVALSTLFIADWRAGAVSTLIMVALLLTTKYMSLSTVLSLLAAPFLLYFFKAEGECILIYAVISIIVLFRHRENFRRLFKGEESRFHLGKH